MFQKRFVHIQHGWTDVFVLHEEVASAALLQAWSGYNQRDADDGVIVSGGFAAQVVVHEHLAVIGHEDEVAVLKPASLLQMLQDDADLFVEMDEIGEVELAVVAPVRYPVRPIPVVRAVTDGIGNQILVDPLQESLRRMERGMGLHIADVRVQRLVRGRFINEVQGPFRDPVGLRYLFREGQGIVAFGPGFQASIITCRPYHLLLCPVHPLGQVDLPFAIGIVIR